jgi:hypothetical protein
VCAAPDMRACLHHRPAFGCLPVTESVALPPDPRVSIKPSLQLTFAEDHTLYTHSQLLELRRKMLRYARLLPRGSERNERRQIASSLRSLFRNKAWLDAHTVRPDGGFLKCRPRLKSTSPYGA